MLHEELLGADEARNRAAPCGGRANPLLHAACQPAPKPERTAKRLIQKGTGDFQSDRPGLGAGLFHPGWVKCPGVSGRFDAMSQR